MKNIYTTMLVIAAVFVTWFITRTVYVNRAMEFFTTNFNSSGNNLEEDIKGYRFAFGDRRSDSDQYFGFDDDIRSGFAKRLLPDIIPRD